MPTSHQVGPFQRLSWTPLLGLAALVLFVIQIAAFSGVRADDAYITYRYGQNWANGLGPVFNPGQRVQGFTSPGHMALAALAYVLFGMYGTPTAMAALGCVGWSLQALAVYRLLADVLGSLGAGLIALGVALGAAGAAHFVALETDLVAALVLVSFVLGKEARWAPAAVSCGLAVLMRPDAALAAGLLASACLYELRARAVWPAVLFFALVLPWLIFATVFYGSPVPQTAVTKFQATGVLPYLLHELRHPAAQLMPPMPVLLQIGSSFALSAVGAVRLLRRSKRLWPLIAFGVLHALAYLVLRPFTMHTWHLYPWVLVLWICSLAALVPTAAGRGAWHWASSVGCGVLLLMAAYRFVNDCRGFDAGYWTGQRDAAYRRVAGYLGEHAQPADWFAAIEVGTVAYYTNLSAYDLGGLVTRADDPAAAHPLRWLVLDKLYVQRSPPSPPVLIAREGDFEAYLFEFGRR
jgi:hypothetical protein